VHLLVFELNVLKYLLPYVNPVFLDSSTNEDGNTILSFLTDEDGDMIDEVLQSVINILSFCISDDDFDELYNVVEQMFGMEGDGAISWWDNALNVHKQSNFEKIRNHAIRLLDKESLRK
jgi:hypothetical protein